MSDATLADLVDGDRRGSTSVDRGARRRGPAGLPPLTRRNRRTGSGGADQGRAPSSGTGTTLPRGVAREVGPATVSRMHSLSDLAPSLLAQLGVTDVDVRDQLTAAATQVLGDLGYDASVVGLHHGVLTLACDPIEGALLRYDTDRIVDAVNLRMGRGDVRRIVLHTS